MSEDREASLVRISGKVQGVGYRVWARRQAIELGVEGWVRNERDGSVSALVIGSRQSIQLMIERLGRGPAGAQVTGVTTQPGVPETRTEGFVITHDLLVTAHFRPPLYVESQQDRRAFRGTIPVDRSTSTPERIVAAI